jgi:hypothetical protein
VPYPVFKPVSSPGYEITAPSLIEAINYQHQRHQLYEPLAQKPRTPENVRDLDALTADLFQWADDVIRGRLKRLQEKVPGLRDDIQKYLDP